MTSVHTRRKLWCLLGVLAGLMAAGSPVAGQGPQTEQRRTTMAAPKPTDAAGKEWVPPRTPWGDPDLQGIYNYATSTQLERPKEFGDKAVLTPDEAQAYQKQRAGRVNTDDDPRAGVGNYNDVWRDPTNVRLAEGNRTSLIIDPPNGRMPARVPLTPERRKEQEMLAVMNARFEAGFMESYTDGDVGNRCIIRRRNEGGGHPYLPAGYNNMAQIFQTPGYVVIYAEMLHHSRIIPVDGRPHLSPKVKTWLGDPRGRWEGNTLVVETTNFRSDDSMGRPLGRTGVTWGDTNPDTYTIVERFERVSPEQVSYTVTMADPETWTQPVTMRIPWNKINEQIYEYACQETNYELYNWLSSARTREARGEVFDPNAPGMTGAGQNER